MLAQAVIVEIFFTSLLKFREKDLVRVIGRVLVKGNHPQTTTDTRFRFWEQNVHYALL